MYDVVAFGKLSQDAKFQKLTVQRGDLGPDDIEIEIQFCGVCHSDLHVARDEFGFTNYPCVPGHEIAGIVKKAGANVKKFKVGDKAGIGCMVDSCRKCPACDSSDENFCQNVFTQTYNTPTIHKRLSTNAGYTFGGYSSSYTVPQDFAIRIPPSYPLEYAGPVFCAGITMYSPLKHWQAHNGGKTVGIVGIGGLGQMGVRLAKAMGNEVTAISTSPGKRATAESIGASQFVVSTDPESMKKAEGSLDLILNTVSAAHQVATYLPLLKENGAIVQLGLVTKPHEVVQFPLIMRRLSIAGSMIGGMSDTQEVIDFCDKHNIKPEIEIITADKLDHVYDVLDKKNDSIKRFVIDMKKSI